MRVDKQIKQKPKQNISRTKSMKLRKKGHIILQQNEEANKEDVKH